MQMLCKIIFVKLFSNSSEKEYENKTLNSGQGQRFEILLKPFEKSRKKENAVDDDIQIMPVSQNKSISKKYTNLKINYL